MAPKNAYDNLSVGDSFGRRLTISDAHMVLANATFADAVPLHTDDSVGRASMYGGRIAPGPLLSGMAAVTMGMQFEGAAQALLEFRERFKGPVMPGDTVTMTWTVASKEDKKRFEGGVVKFVGQCVNQRDQVVLELDSVVIITNRPPDG